jgi:hypothetical protein
LNRDLYPSLFLGQAILAQAISVVMSQLVVYQPRVHQTTIGTALVLTSYPALHYLISQFFLKRLEVLGQELQLKAIASLQHGTGVPLWSFGQWLGYLLREFLHLSLSLGALLGAFLFELLGGASRQIQTYLRQRR